MRWWVMVDCVFCGIGSGEIPGDVLYRDDDCFVIRDIAPLAPTHLLVIPVEHFAEVSDLGAGGYGLFGSMFRAVVEVAEREGVLGTGYRLVVNQGDDGGQEVMHLHMHLLGGKRLGGLGLG